MAPSSYRPHIAKLNRSDLEDSYYRLFDENQALKVEINTQQDKLKKMAAKVLKTMAGKMDSGGFDGDELSNRISELEKQNALLKAKLQSAKHQLATYARRPLSPGYRPSSTISHRRPPSAGPSPQARPQPEPPAPQRPTTVTQQQMVLHTRSIEHQRKLEQTIDELQQKLYEYEDQMAVLNDKLQTKAAELEETALQLKTKLTSEQRVTIQENIQVIRLQQQIKNKSQSEAQAMAKSDQIERNLRSLKTQHDEICHQFDHVNTQLRTEQNLNSQLESQLQALRAAQGTNTLQTAQELDNLRRENQVLKETHEKLISNAFNSDRENSWMQNERQLRGRISELENAVRSDVNTRNEILEKLAGEIGSREKAEEECRKIEVQMLQLKADNERMDRKMKALTSGGMSWSDIEEALALIRQKKDIASEISITRPEFMQQLPPDNNEQQDALAQLERLKVSYAETVQELEKTRNMLLVQHRICSDYQVEMDLVNRRSEQHKSEFEKQLKSYAQLLDQRALRIQRLESYLHDLAYGRKPYKAGIEISDEKPALPQLEPGQNLLEIKLTKLNLSQDALKWMQSAEPSMFLTVEFFDFEIQFTPVTKGPIIEMDYTCEYTVMASDLFLHYLETDSASLEMHQALGTSYKTWAAGALFMRDLLKSSDGRLFGTVTLSGVATEAVGVHFGELEFSVQFKVPIDRAMALYKERAHALGYLLADREQTDGIPAPKAENNQLLVIVHRCNAIKAKHPEMKAPSPYVMYQVFDFADHDTKVIASNANPEFGDQRVWSLPIGPELDNYLRTKAVRFLVFDDAAPSDDLAYLGHADVPLLPLSQNKAITGTFDLLSDKTETNGTVDVSISWKFIYVPPQQELIVTKPMVELGPETSLPEVSAAPPVPPKRGPRAVRVQPGPRAVLPSAGIAHEVHARPSDTIVVEESIDDIPLKEERKLRETQDDAQTQPSAPPLVRQGSYTVIPAQEEKKPVLENSSSSESSPSDRPGPGAPPPYTESLLRMEPKPALQPLEPIVRVSSQGPLPPVQGGLPPIAAPRKPKVVEIIEKPTQIFEREPSSAESDEYENGQTAMNEASVLKVGLRIGGLWLPEDSPLLEDPYDDTKVFIQWDFLDLEEDECQTESSVHLPRQPSQEVDFECRKEINLTESQLELLRNSLKADTKMNFELLVEPEDEEEKCDELGRAELKLVAAWQNDTDTSDHIIKFVSEHGHTMAFQRIALSNLDELRSQLSV